MLSTAANSCCDRRPADATLTGSATASATASPAPAKTRILFVDDEPSMLRVLKMGMRTMTSSWEMEFAGDGEQALVLVEQKPFDVVVTDMRMSGMNGAQLLNHILRRDPQTIRIILSGYSDLLEVVNCVGLTHQFLSKPCSLDELKNCLKRVTQVKTQLASAPLCKLTAGLKSLPSLPELYIAIAEAIQSPTASAQRIAEIAAQDAGLSAKLLQLSNSAFFGFSREVFSVEEAVQLLGVTVIQSLAMAVPIFSAFRRERCPEFPLDQIWEHSVQTALLARQIGSEHSLDPHMAEQAFCAGILHDLGKIILADGLPEEYSALLREARETNTPLIEVERKHLNATHAEVGAYLLALWGLPIPLVEAVANHHHPRRCGTEELCLAGIVHLANVLQHAESHHADMANSPVDMDYLQHLGLEKQFELWRAELPRG
jgi:putative nucleotidyltransferase with HDIG domain